MKVLVTGSAGFIGAALAQALLARGDEVVGLDNHNDYYDVSLKEARLALFADHPNYTHLRMDLADRSGMAEMFAKYKPQRVVNLAAQAGVRYSLDNPLAYIDSNIVGFSHVLEGCRHNGVEQLVYASSSSVYGANTAMPFSVHHNVDHPLSLYAASKKTNELMAHTYSHLFGLPTTGLRFFTVYGPWSRPDMAMIKFAKAIMVGQPINCLADIASQAGRAIMAVYETDFNHRLKADDSPVTEADIQVDQIICDGLTKAFPNIPIVSEERQHHLPADTKEFFLVDQLDGTEEFLARNGEFTVNIALIHGGMSVAGVDGAPAQDLLYLAGQGIGAFRRDASGDTPLRVKSKISGEPIRVIGSRSHTSPEMAAWMAGLSEPYEFISVGSSLKFCRIADGAADIYPRFGPTCQWDTAAGQCILEFSGEKWLRKTESHSDMA